MNLETTKKVNEAIIALCDYTLEVIKENSADKIENLPSLVNALANLIQSR
ncbi:hypothetical protein [Lysinibacillus sp. FSL M8-0134]